MVQHIKNCWKHGGTVIWGTTCCWKKIREVRQPTICQSAWYYYIILPPTYDLMLLRKRKVILCLCWKVLPIRTMFLPVFHPSGVFFISSVFCCSVRGLVSCQRDNSRDNQQPFISTPILSLSLTLHQTLQYGHIFKTYYFIFYLYFNSSIGLLIWVFLSGCNLCMKLWRQFATNNSMLQSFSNSGQLW